MSHSSHQDPASQQTAQSPQPADVHSTLRYALRLPRASPKVAEWLFDENDKDFHTASCRLSPESFKASRNFVYSTHFLPITAVQPCHANASDSPSQDSDSSTLHMIFIPADIFDGIIVGYGLHIGWPFDPGLLPFRGALRSAFAEVMRFALDCAGDHLVVYKREMSKNESMLATLDLLGGSRRMRCIFSIPPDEYSPRKLPSQILGATVLDEIILKPPSESRIPTDRAVASFENGQSSEMLANGLWDDGDVRTLHPYLLDDLGSGAAPSIRTMSHGSRGESQGESQRIPSSPIHKPASGRVVKKFITLEVKGEDSTNAKSSSSRRSVTSAGASLDYLNFSSASDWLQRMVSGYFHSPMVTRDVSLPPSAPMIGTVVGHLSTKVTRGSPDQMKLLQMYAARSYYAAAVGVGVDMRLMQYVRGGDIVETEEQQTSRPVSSA